jgi:hypothetical protein
MSLRYTPPSRRTFLKLISSAGAASLFGRALWPQVAEAATPAPLRYLSLLTYHGKLKDLWKPQGTETAPNITFTGSTLAPLAPHLSKMLVLSGLDMKVLYDQGTTGHEGGPASVFTGSKLVSGHAASPSLDVFLSDRLGGATAIRAVQVVNHILYCSDESGMSYSASGARLPLLAAPLDIYNRLFSGFTPGTGTPPPVDPSVPRRAALVQFWLKDANRLRARLAPAEQHKLDAHLSALQDIERRIDTTPPPPPTTCALPTKPRAYSNNELSGCGGLAGENLIPERTKLIMDIFVQAFACDRTRFGAVSLWPGLEAPFLSSSGENVHDVWAHQSASSATAKANLANLHRWYAGVLKDFLDGLAAVQEGDGSLLDHSLMLWGNELSDPAAHSNTDMPYVLFGGANGALRMGRSLSFSSGTWHNKLLASVAQVFDPSVTSFGDAAYSGTLSGLT